MRNCKSYILISFVSWNSTVVMETLFWNDHWSSEDILIKAFTWFMVDYDFLLGQNTYLWNLTCECHLMSAIYNLNFDLRSGVERKFVYKHLLYRPRFLYTQRRKIWPFKLILWLFREYSLILPLKVKWCHRYNPIHLVWIFVVIQLLYSFIIRLASFYFL